MRGMGVGVFGPVHLEGTSLSPRERMVLSALVLRAGRLTTTDELAEAVWGDEPPETWAKQLQASIGRVRVAIGRNLIETTPGGYALRIDPDMIDVERFERLAASARHHLDGGDPARAIDAADRALTLARGAAYADLAAWPPAVVESERLDELRMGLEEVRLDARLQLGEHAASVADAERLVRESPLRERRWTVLATALYRSGRQADALAAIRAAKERLAEELGAEPGVELRELELAILRHDDSLDLGETPAAPSGTCPYRGLAAFGVEDEDDFFGRAADTAAALARLIRSRFLAVSGASGSGKSSLVRAGLVPALQRRGDSVTLLTPERDLDVRVRNAVRGAGRADVIVVDQFEEVFHSGEADVDAAARAIAEAAASGTAVVLVVRSDFLDDCAAHPDLAPLVAEGVHLVGPMASDALREAIEQPAKRAGLRLEPGLVELLLRDAAGEAGALPQPVARTRRDLAAPRGGDAHGRGVRGLRRHLRRDRAVRRPSLPVHGRRAARALPLSAAASGRARTRRQPRAPPRAIEAAEIGCRAQRGAHPPLPIATGQCRGGLGRGGARVAGHSLAAAAFLAG